ncbi:protein argonaute 2-like [Senna tora]|uniref:Protein argonaute 2-like n=1 Tax=Senna tora TaxID=362788 RepID=A0A834TW69_9FABA|nr:protein argonaute 2-like [Senna tora]
MGHVMLSAMNGGSGNNLRVKLPIKRKSVAIVSDSSGKPQTCRVCSQRFPTWRVILRGGYGRKALTGGPEGWVDAALGAGVAGVVRGWDLNEGEGARGGDYKGKRKATDNDTNPPLGKPRCLECQIDEFPSWRAAFAHMQAHPRPNCGPPPQPQPQARDNRYHYRGRIVILRTRGRRRGDEGGAGPSRGRIIDLNNPTEGAVGDGEVIDQSDVGFEEEKQKKNAQGRVKHNFDLNELPPPEEDDDNDIKDKP